MTILKRSSNLETKFQKFDTETGLKRGAVISGYASLFGKSDQGGDVVQRGAYVKSLENLKRDGRSIKMLWQHDPAKPIGVWDEVYEDQTGLFVKGRILTEIQSGQEAMALIKAGAVDGLSIGYQTVQSEKNSKGQRLLHELELWEVSLVTFPMLPEARVDEAETLTQTLAIDLAEALAQARRELLS